ncbi:speriolin-like protein [Chanodichthys erythropterus]|uniref:speriolin-like protein n=1 Tax=Chanodichthys erythropterus TaxID=933992 RepID=UPI00351E1C65
MDAGKRRHEMDHLDEENADLQSEPNRYTSTDGLITQTGSRSNIEWSTTVDEGRFSDVLLKRAHKTSSTLNLLHTDASAVNHEEMPSCSFTHQTLRDHSRLLGEIAFQLDRRILSHVFQEQSRLYGFTVQNIRDKIEQVSIHPLNGTVDEAYKFQLLKRHTEITDRLHSLGYNMSLHPAFSEFIVNTYGILKETPDAREPAYTNPEFLRRVIVETAPSRLLKDLLLLLSCLCFMARLDGRSLFLW